MKALKNIVPDVIMIVTSVLMVINMIPHKVPEPRPGINPVLWKYVWNFQHYGKYYLGPNFVVPKMDIDLGDTSGVPSLGAGFTTIGWCRKDKTPKIMIDKATFDRMDETEREILLFHELGHCVLDRWHRNTRTPYLVPVSIMGSVIMDASYYEFDKGYYLRELFTTKDKSPIQKILDGEPLEVTFDVIR